ncbi:MAG: alpha/beta hydrolase [Glaciecola sp.]
MQIDSGLAKQIIKRNNVQVIGEGEKTLMLAHGFGCDQNMWRFMLPLLQQHYRIVIFDYVGCGQSDLSAYLPSRYKTLQGYAEDVVQICEALALENVYFIGHSVSGTIGGLAAVANPQLFKKIIMVCPSPSFLNFPPEYFGGFEKEDLEELINLMDKNYIGWANYLAPLVMGEQSDPSFSEELENSFCSTDPNFAKPFAKATFFSDYRAELASLALPVLIIQSANDSLAGVEVGKYMHEKISDSSLEIVEAHGHCLHMTQPSTISELIDDFILHE